MALLPLHLLGSPVLRQRSDEVERVDDDVRALVESMFQTMDAAKGVGLAANQIGIARRVAVIDADGHRIAMINPRVVSAEGRALANAADGQTVLVRGPSGQTISGIARSGGIVEVRY